MTDEEVNSPNMEIVARYRLYDGEGSLLDESAPHQPMRFVAGRGQVLPVLEQALSGAASGDRLSVHLSAEEAYGPHRPELVFEVVRDNLPPGIEIRPGMRFNPGGQRGRFQLKVIELTERGALMDGNHPYAGMALHFEFEILHGKPACDNCRSAGSG